MPAFQGQGIMQEAISKVIAFAHEVIGLKVIEAYTHLEDIAVLSKRKEPLKELMQFLVKREY